MNRRMPKRSSVLPVSAALSRFSRRYSASLSDFLRFCILWRKAAGDYTARASYAYKCRGGTLFIKCRTSAWAEELKNMAPDLIKALNREEGGEHIRALRFTITNFTDPVMPPEEKRSPDVEFGAETLKKADSISSLANSPSLRTAVREAYLAGKKREMLDDMNGISEK